MRDSGNVSSSEDEDGASRVEKPKRMSKKTARAQKYKEMKEDVEILKEMDNPRPSTSAPLMREQAKIMLKKPLKSTSNSSSNAQETSEQKPKKVTKFYQSTRIGVKRKSTRVSKLQVEGKADDPTSDSDHVAKRRKMKIDSSDESDSDAESPDLDLHPAAPLQPESGTVSEEPIAISSTETPGADLNLNPTSPAQAVDSNASLSNPNQTASSNSNKKGRAKPRRGSQNASPEMAEMIAEPDLSTLNYRIGINTGTISTFGVAQVPTGPGSSGKVASLKRTGKENHSSQTNDSNKPPMEESTVATNDSNCSQAKQSKLSKEESGSSARTRADFRNFGLRSSARFSKNSSTSTGRGRGEQ